MKCYYIGEKVNGLKHGRGTLYSEDGRIIYEGDFKNNLFEGTGRYNYSDGYYYIGEFQKGLKHGKGSDYYENGNTIYEGTFVNDMKEGKGKMYNIDGQYYIGEVKNKYIIIK